MKLTKQQENLRVNDSVQSILIDKRYGLEMVCPIVLHLGYNCIYIDEEKNYFRVRQFNPGLHKKPTYKTVNSKMSGVKYIIESGMRRIAH